MFCEPYLYVTSLCKFIFICMVRQLCNKKKLVGNNEWARVEAQPRGTGLVHLTAI